MLKAPRPKLNVKASRPLSYLHLGTRRHSKDTNSSNQNLGFSNRPWTSNITGKIDTNKNVASAATTKVYNEATYR